MTNLVPTAGTRSTAKHLVRRFRTLGAEGALEGVVRLGPHQRRLLLVLLLSEFAKCDGGMGEPAPRDGYRFSRDERHALRKLYLRGIRTPDTIDAEREYQRRIKEDNKDFPPDRMDEAVVQRILDGEWRLKCSHPERREVIRIWREGGGTNRGLGELTGWNVGRELRRAA